MSIQDSIRIAGLWRVGKMIGGDEDEVRDDLLAEVERLTAELEALRADAALRETRAQLMGMEIGWKYGYEQNMHGFRALQDKTRADIRDALEARKGAA